MDLRDWPALSADYAKYHRSPGNQACHAFGIPLIVFAVVAWTRVPAAAGFPAVALALPIYWIWSARLGAVMTLAIVACSAAASYLPGWVAATAFVVGWILQLAGHQFYEGQSPAFLRNATHLLVGPAWIAEKAFGRTVAAGYDRAAPDA